MRVIYATLLNRLALPDEENLTGDWIIPDISQHTIEGPMSSGSHGRSGLAQRAMAIISTQMRTHCIVPSGLRTLSWLDGGNEAQ